MFVLIIYVVPYYEISKASAPYLHTYQSKPMARGQIHPCLGTDEKKESHVNICVFRSSVIYCRVPARRGLQRTAWAATRHGARDPLVRPQVEQAR